jgi:stage V sporulation protein R
MVCIAYMRWCLDSNTIVDNVTVIAHALGHNDFFKNNVFFSPTSQNMMNQLANNGTRIRKYIARWGKEKVTEFIDHVLRIDTLIDFNKAWDNREIKDIVIKDSRKYHHPNRLDVDEQHDYMENYINDPNWIRKQKQRIENVEIAEELELFANSTKDILGHIRDNAPLKPWQQDIVAMLWQESMYFAPQRTTKMLNEGWASYTDYVMMCRKGLVGLGQATHDSGIIEYAANKMGVLGGRYSMNPYKLGFCLFLDIEERWNKGRFGQEYDECVDRETKANWDQKLDLGYQKVFEVRKSYNDLTALIEFFTPEFCDKYEFFNWDEFPNGDIKIKDRKFKEIKKNLIDRYKGGGLPEIYLVDDNYNGKGYMMLQHKWDGKELYQPFVKPVLQSLRVLWNNNVYLASKNKAGEEIIYVALSSRDEDIGQMTRAEFENKKSI